MADLKGHTMTDERKIDRETVKVVDDLGGVVAIVTTRLLPGFTPSSKIMGMNVFTIPAKDTP
jgi:hypothetical protein